MSDQAPMYFTSMYVCPEGAAEWVPVEGVDEITLAPAELSYYDVAPEWPGFPAGESFRFTGLLAEGGWVHGVMEAISGSVGTWPVDSGDEE